jgi:hypothetical protein
MRVSLIAGVILLSSPAIAEDSPARGLFEDFNKCVVDRRPKEAAELVLSHIPNEDILRKYPDLLVGDCLGYTAEYLRLPSGEFIRYGLAEALVRREYPEGVPPDIGRAAPLPHPPINEADYQPETGKRMGREELEKLQKRKQQAQADHLLSIYGDCVVRADPAAAHRLVFTEPSSAQESLGFAALKHAFSQCLVAGQTLTFSRSSLRGTIAMNLYRLAKAPRIAASPQAQ